jgi:hypothetical protein
MRGRVASASRAACSPWSGPSRAGGSRSPPGGGWTVPRSRSRRGSGAGPAAASRPASASRRGSPRPPPSALRRVPRRRGRSPCSSAATAALLEPRTPDPSGATADCPAGRASAAARTARSCGTGFIPLLEPRTPAPVGASDWVAGEAGGATPVRLPGAAGGSSRLAGGRSVPASSRRWPRGANQSNTGGGWSGGGSCLPACLACSRSGGRALCGVPGDAVRDGRSIPAGNAARARPASGGIRSPRPVGAP